MRSSFLALFLLAPACIPGLDVGGLINQGGYAASQIAQQQAAAAERQRAQREADQRAAQARAEAERRRAEDEARRAAWEEQRRQAQAQAQAEADRARAEAEAQRAAADRAQAELALQQAAAEKAAREARCAAERDKLGAEISAGLAPLARPPKVPDECEVHAQQLTELAARYAQVFAKVENLNEAVKSRYQNCLANVEVESPSPALEFFEIRARYATCVAKVAERKAEERRLAAEERKAQADEKKALAAAAARAAEAQRRREAAAEERRVKAEQQEQADLKAYPPPDHGHFMVSCERMIKDRLHAPDDAEFPGIFTMPSRPVTTGLITRWRSWVKAKNLFGVTLRRWYVCTHNSKTDIISVKMEEL